MYGVSECQTPCLTDVHPKTPGQDGSAQNLRHSGPYIEQLSPIKIL